MAVGIVLAFAAPLAAQPRPVVATTLTTTDTSADSLHVGCAVGASSCTGGIKAGTLDTATITSGGAIGIANNVPGVTTMKLYNNAGTLTWNGVALATGGSVSGTLNKIGVFTSASSIGDSIMTQSGTTITVASTLNATTLGGTLSTASQPNVTTLGGLTSASALATVGTITAGTWQGTIVGLTYGGTGSNLSATGGTSQFLRQNGVGSAITVVRPAVADLSDASNVALLNASNVFSSGPQVLTAATASNFLQFKPGGTVKADIGMSGAIKGTAATDLGFYAEVGQGMTWMVNGSATDAMTLSSAGVFTVTGAANAASFIPTGSSAPTNGLYLPAANSIGLATNSNLRWGINAAGDHTFGASSHIADSNGTPSISGTGFGASPTVAGNDYAFTVTNNAGAGVSFGGTILFGHTFSNAPVCAVHASANTYAFSVNTTTTQVVVVSSGGLAANEKVHVLCRGY